MTTYPDYLVENTLKKGGSDWDFEVFGVHLLRRIDGILYQPTSKNYDIGADGKAYTVTNGTPFIVTTLQQERLVKKVNDDITKLKTRGQKFAVLRVCYAYIGTEKKRLAVEQEARKLLPRCPDIEVYGIKQLVDEAGRHSDIFENSYRAQIDVINRQLRSVDSGEEQSTKRRGLRVLLAAQLSDDAESLRSNLLRGLVLQVTKQNTWLSDREIAKDVGDATGLESPISDVYLRPTLQHLIAAGSLEVDSAGLVRRRSTASDSMNATAGAAASRALEGFGAIKRSMASVIEDELPDATFDLIWHEIQKGLVDLFRKYGADFVSFVHTVGNQTGPLRVTMPESILEGVQRIARSIDLLDRVKLSAGLRERIIRSLPAILFDKPSGARDWMTHLCLSYVSACSLGLHPDALRRIESRIKTWDVIPDTHILLSLLGKGEDDHDAVERLIAWWTGAGGAMIAANSSASEVVRHARLCESIIEQWELEWRNRRGSRHPELPDSNVFLRDVLTAHGSAVGPEAVRAALRRFIVPGSQSTERLLRVLVHDYRFQCLPALNVDQSLKAGLLLKIRQRRLKPNYDSDEERQNAENRCTSDAELLAEFAAHRGTLIGAERQAIILTHAAGFTQLCQDHVDHFGVGSVAIDCERLLYTMSLMPGSTFTMKSVQQALFGDAFQREVRRNAKLAKSVASKLAKAGGEYIATMSEEVDDRLSGASYGRDDD